MRVLHVAGEFPPDRLGGVATYLENLVRVTQSECELGVLVARGTAYEHDPAAEPGQAPVERVDLSAALSHAAQVSVLTPGELARRIESSLLRQAWDVVHVHDWYGVLPGLALQALHKTPMVMTAHLPLRRGFSYANHPLSILHKSRLEALGFRLARRIFAPSRSVRDVLLAEYDCPAERIDVVAGGVDSNAFTPKTAAKTESPSVLFAGRLTEQKGVEHALAAFARVRREVPGAHLTIVGSGPCEAWLKAEARRHGLLDVRFRGWVAHHEMASLYARAWVFLCPSIYEPFGLTALEAMSCGTPTVASPFGGAPDFVQDGESGLLCVPQDHEALARSITTLLCDPQLRMRMSAAAREVAAKHSWSRTAAQLAGHYRALAPESALALPCAGAA